MVGLTGVCKWAAKIEKKHWKKYFEEMKSGKKNRRG